MGRGSKILALLSVLFVFWVIAAPLLARNLIVEKPLANADVIFVLSGSAVYLERTGEAALLYEHGISSVILLSDDGTRGGWSREMQTNPKFVDMAKASLMRGGVPESSILVLEGQVSGTFYEAEALAARARTEKWKSVLVVTSAYHTNRALRTIERRLDGTGVKVGIVSPAPGDLTPSPNTWWLKTKGWEMVAGEYVKSIYYEFAF